MKPSVSVGIPVYNGERYLSEAIDCIRGQDFEDLEIIISDNASTDATQEICVEAAAEDTRIRYLRSDVNRGGAWNMNRLYHEASAPLFKWAFYDDVSEPTLVRRCVEELELAGSSAVLAHPRVKEIDENGRVVRERDDSDLQLDDFKASRRLYELYTRMAEQVMFGVIRTEALRRTRGVQHTLSDGLVLLTELGVQGRFVPVDEHLFYFRVHPGQHGGNRDSELRWFRVAKGGRYLFPYTRVNNYLYSAVWRSSLPFNEKVACSSAVLRGWTLLKGRSFASDIKHFGSDFRAASSR